MTFKQFLAEQDSNSAKKVYDDLINTCADHDLTASDTENFMRDIGEKLKQGWTEAEIYSLLRNTEEFNPNLPEERALKKMKEITDKVKARLGK